MTYNSKNLTIKTGLRFLDNEKDYCEIVETLSSGQFLMAYGKDECELNKEVNEFNNKGMNSSLSYVNDPLIHIMMISEEDILYSFKKQLRRYIITNWKKEFSK